MAREKSGMELHDLLHRMRLDHGNKKIHRETGTHRTVIRKLRTTAETRGWLNRQREMPSEKELWDAYHGVKERPGIHPLEAYHTELADYAEKEYSYVVMHELMKGRHHCSESTIRRFVQARIKGKAPRAVTQRQRELLVMEVDFGELGTAYDWLEKRNRKAYVFSGRLRYSAKAYRKVVFNQKQETFWQCHVESFEYFGGVTERVVPDNLKAAVIQASFTDPKINRGYRELAKYYGFLIDNCLPYHPQHKGGVENDIKYIKRNFWPVFKERQKQKGQDIPNVGEIQAALNQWTEEIADIRIIKNVGVSPNELFVREAAQLKALPAERYDVPVWKKCTVSRAARIHFERSTYSVPEKYIGKEVMTAGYWHKIRIYSDDELITEHIRAERPYEDIVKEDHRSHRAIAYLNYTKENLLKQARLAGEYTAKIVEAIISDRVVSGGSPAWGIVSLGKKYGADRLEQACLRAWEFGAHNYKSVKRILAQGLEAQGEDATAAENRGHNQFLFARTGRFL